MNPVQFKADYVVGDMVPAGTIVLQEGSLFFAIEETNSVPDNTQPEWAQISNPNVLHAATPADKTPATSKPTTNGPFKDASPVNSKKTLQFGGRRRTMKKPRRK